MSILWEGKPLPNPAAEFEHLLNQRELAAARAVSVIGQVLDFWEAQDYDSAKAQLERARAEFQEADARVIKFRKSYSKGENSHGNRNVA